ncbi:CLIP domain-containing serine protease B4-like isoform X1 [Bacillus rossius redtenbacheri]|uniref:CLIP domain-containing serine protease B4-like isoform X1 n=2 Tax=Bacillus rossius redtenbacheri TaxID=93214 RepID=UPI002FDD38CD
MYDCVSGTAIFTMPILTALTLGAVLFFNGWAVTNFFHDEGKMKVKTCSDTPTIGGSKNHTRRSADGDLPPPLFEPHDHPNWQLFEHEQCGAVATDRTAYGDEVALGDFRWVARIGYISDEENIPKFGCGAVLVSKYYLVTAAHCVINLPNKLKIGVVRLGEHDSSTDPDCQGGFCSDPVMDYRVAEVMAHPAYGRYKNDIALIRTDREVEFTKWIKPICVIAGPLMNKSFIGDHPDVAGWGVYGLDKPERSVRMQKARLQVVESGQCEPTYRRLVRLDDTQMCAGGTVCVGDSGGPLMLLDGSRYFLVGVQSLSSSRCGSSGKPGVYTRASAFMQWIMEHMHP